LISSLGCRCDTETKKVFEKAFEKRSEDLKKQETLEAVHVAQGFFITIFVCSRYRSARTLEAGFKMKLDRDKYIQKIAQLRILQSSLFEFFTYRACFFVFDCAPA
jgi:hypothetical protein